MSLPQSRWEFGVILSGWGATKEEAWLNILDSYFRVGEKEGCHVMEVAKTDKEAGKLRRQGKDYAMRCEMDDTSYGPDGTMLVWEES